MDTNNPYIEEKRRLVVACEKDLKNLELARQLEEVEVKSRVYTRGIMAKLSARISEVGAKAEQTRKPLEKISMTKQYAEMIAIHRESKELVKVIQGYKKELIDEMNSKRKKKEVKENGSSSI